MKQYTLKHSFQHALAIDNALAPPDQPGWTGSHNQGVNDEEGKDNAKYIICTTKPKDKKNNSAGKQGGPSDNKYHVIVVSTPLRIV